MNVLEAKMAAVMRLLVAEDDAEYQDAKKEIRRLMKGEEPVNQEDAETLVRGLLVEIGAPDHLIGHRYAIQAILLVMKDFRYIDQITRSLYPCSAQEFDTTPPRVERAIRHLIEEAWNRCDLDVLDRYFGNTVNPEKGKPTNGEFIARMANMAKLRMKQ